MNMDFTPENWQDRTELLLGAEPAARLKHASVLVIGLGGVGGTAAEMICRAGVGAMTIADGDRIEPTNLNRQLPALVSTLGRYKTEVMAERLKAVNPGLDLAVTTAFLEGEGLIALLKSRRFDCVLDAIDSLTPKIQLAAACLDLHIPLGHGSIRKRSAVPICPKLSAVRLRGPIGPVWQNSASAKGFARFFLRNRRSGPRSGKIVLPRTTVRLPARSLSCPLFSAVIAPRLSSGLCRHGRKSRHPPIPPTKYLAAKNGVFFRSGIDFSFYCCILSVYKDNHGMRS